VLRIIPERGYPRNVLAFKKGKYFNFINTFRAAMKRAYIQKEHNYKIISVCDIIPNYDDNIVSSSL